MFDALELNVKRLLKAMMVRLAVVSFSFLLIYVAKPDLFGMIIILLVPLMLLQVWLDRKFIIKKQLFMSFWVVVFFLVSVVACFYGLICLVFFYVLYFIYRLYRARKDKDFEMGVSLIKNCKRLADNFLRGKKE